MKNSSKVIRSHLQGGKPTKKPTKNTPHNSPTWILTSCGCWSNCICCQNRCHCCCCHWSTSTENGFLRKEKKTFKLRLVHLKYIYLLWNHAALTVKNMNFRANILTLFPNLILALKIQTREMSRWSKRVCFVLLGFFPSCSLPEPWCGAVASVFL